LDAGANPYEKKLKKSQSLSITDEMKIRQLISNKVSDSKFKHIADHLRQKRAKKS